MSYAVIKGRLQQRKRPQQERSILRLEAILNAAFVLVAEKSVAEVTMSEIAQRAGIPIGSLYQYFPHKNSVIIALFQRFSVEVEAYIRKIFTGSHSLDNAAQRACDALDELHGLLRQQPVFLVLWQAILSDRELNTMTVQFQEKVTAIFRRDLGHLFAEVDPQTFAINLRLMIVTSAEVMRYAAGQPLPVARLYIEQWQAIIMTTIFGLAQAGADHQPGIMCPARKRG